MQPVDVADFFETLLIPFNLTGTVTSYTFFQYLRSLVSTLYFRGVNVMIGRNDDRLLLMET